MVMALALSLSWRSHWVEYDGQLPGVKNIGMPSMEVGKRFLMSLMEILSMVITISGSMASCDR